MRVRTVDIRQVMAAFLTLSMLGMLANMIKRDHFDYVEVKYPRGSTIQYHAIKITGKRSAIEFPEAEKGLPMKEKRQLLKPCWKISSPKERQQPRGYITFSLTNGPEYHVSQVANAVVVATYLGAILVLPDIRGKKPEERRNFSEIYDDQKFISSLKGVVEVTRDQPIGASRRKPPAVRVPNIVSEAYITAHIKPLFQQERILRIWTYFPSISKRKNEAPKAFAPTACLALFGALQLQPHIRGITDGILQRLRNSAEGSKRNVVAVYLRDEVLRSKRYRQLGDGEINFCDANEVGKFLRKSGFGPETAIYLTRSRWHDSLDSIRDLFPRTYTKELMNPQDQRDSVLGKVIDFIVCSESDVYVPIIEDRFSTNVAGARIASGRMEILVPTKISGFSGSPSDYIAPYISKKTHLAYSCLC